MGCVGKTWDVVVAWQQKRRVSNKASAKWFVWTTAENLLYTGTLK